MIGRRLNLRRRFVGSARALLIHDLLHAYAVTDKACKVLIERQTPVVFNSDPLVSYLIVNGRLNAFSTLPQFFTQEMFIDPAQRSFIHHL